MVWIGLAGHFLFWFTFAHRWTLCLCVRGGLLETWPGLGLGWSLAPPPWWRPAPHSTPPAPPIPSSTTGLELCRWKLFLSLSASPWLLFSLGKWRRKIWLGLCVFLPKLLRFCPQACPVTGVFPGLFPRPQWWPWAPGEGCGEKLVIGL